MLLLPNVERRSDHPWACSTHNRGSPHHRASLYGGRRPKLGPKRQVQRVPVLKQALVPVGKRGTYTTKCDSLGPEEELGLFPNYFMWLRLLVDYKVIMEHYHDPISRALMGKRLLPRHWQGSKLLSLNCIPGNLGPGSAPTPRPDSQMERLLSV